MHVCMKTNVKTSFVPSFPQNLRTRIAPTPSGFLHIGNAFSFILSWLLARKHGGTVLLRIDDLDAARMRQAYLADIFESLEWLGIDYDEGPTNPHDFLENFSQQHRLPLYQQYAHALQERANTFYCACSRKQIAAQATDGQYPMTCRAAALPACVGAHALRVCTPEGLRVTVPDVYASDEVHLFAQTRDFVVVRKDGVPAYHLASLADDAHYGINCIVRGSDLWLSTAAQQFLAMQLDEPNFLRAVFVHHPLFTDASGRKLSKSEGASALRVLRAQGDSPQHVYRQVAQRLGLPASAGESLGTLCDAIDFTRPLW